MDRLESIRQKLTKAGLKATQQRLVILDSICNSKKHPSAENIFEKVRVRNPSISLATVYSTLETLVRKGVINKVLVKGGVMRYDAHTDHHNHIHCINTDEIIDFEDEELHELIAAFLKKKPLGNFKIKEVSLHIQGEKLDKRKNITFN